MVCICLSDMTIKSFIYESMCVCLIYASVYIHIHTGCVSNICVYQDKEDNTNTFPDTTQDIDDTEVINEEMD